METRTGRFVLREDFIDISSDLGGAQIPWARISEVWEEPAYWMIFMGRNQFFTLPVADVSAMGLDYIRTKVASTSV
jgi:hypothetical protein